MLIGFIDYYLDEWHANNYPTWLKEVDPDCEVAYAYAMIDSPNEGGLTTDEWCAQNGVTRCLTIDEVVEKSDAIVVLSPDHCDLHEGLCQVPLRSGKPVYIDKTFSPTLAMGKRIFAVAEKAGTPCYSTSALRFTEEYLALDADTITGISSIGGAIPDTYIIHQLEPIMMLMKAQAKRVMAMSSPEFYTYTIEFNDGRVATANQFVQGMPFALNVAFKNGSGKVVNAESDFFHDFIIALAHFFKTREVPVDHAETLKIMAVREAALKAITLPGQWIAVEQI